MTTSLMTVNGGHLIPNHLEKDFLELYNKLIRTPDEEKRWDVYRHVISAGRAHERGVGSLERGRVSTPSEWASGIGVAGAVIGIVASAVLLAVAIFFGLGFSPILFASLCLIGSLAGVGAHLTTTPWLS